MAGVIHHYLTARAELDAPGSPFATHMTTIRGVPAKSYVAAPPTMRAIWETTVVHGDKDYLVYEDERYTYADIHAQVRKLAAHLVANGVTPGSRASPCATTPSGSSVTGRGSRSAPPWSA